MNSQIQFCPICASTSTALDVVDFNKSCEEPKGKYLPLSGIPIYYFLCNNCDFCFSPEICAWSINDFETKIYNDDYVMVDPDYVDSRPRQNAEYLINMFSNQKAAIRHLDYGGGEGMLSRLLREQGFDSTSFDPFVDKQITNEELGKFNLITAFEVFEHVPSVNELKKQLVSLLTDDGIILFSTLLSDGHIKRHERLTWWYASPRNGHISLYSKKSLSIIAQQEQFVFGSFSEGFHVFCHRVVPTWASHIINLP
jgi:hypothetical protein